MATAILHTLPVAPHQLWQTAASPFIIPNQWQMMYQRCPRCGGSAPNVCDAVWPENWWEDDMMGLMYQGHIPPSQRTAPWDGYYAKSRVTYMPSQPVTTALRIDTSMYSYPQVQYVQVDQRPITPPNTPGMQRHSPYYASHMAPRPTTPTSPTLPYSRQTTSDNAYGFGNPFQRVEFGMSF